MSGALRLKAATSCVGSSRLTDLTDYTGALRYWVGWHAVKMAGHFQYGRAAVNLMRAR